jgi:hypothetical protein
MPLIGAHIALVPRYVWLGQKCENVFMYFTGGAAFALVSAADVAEAWWNDVKDDLRALAPASITDCRFTSVVCRNLVDGGELGEYAVPDGENTGTTDPTESGNPVTGTLAGGVRLTVGNTTTRPGQKRFPFLYEADINGNALEAGYLARLETLAAHIDSPITLGAPVLAGGLIPVVGGTVVDGYPTVYQDVIGHIVNPYVTSQVSRKLGHGS